MLYKSRIFVAAFKLFVLLLLLINGPKVAKGKSPTAGNDGLIVRQPGQMFAPHPAGCAPGEVYLSAQDWWVNATGDDRGSDGELGESFGHLHSELCFPHKATIQGDIVLHIKSVMHHNPGEFSRLMVQLFNNNDVINEPRLCGDRHALACIEFEPPRTIDTCEETGGELKDNDNTCVWWDEMVVDTRNFDLDGWQQFRVRGFVREPDGEEMRTSTGLHAYIDNGNPHDDVYENPDVIEARGWYGREVNYTNASIHDMPLEPVSGVWRPYVALEKGSRGIPVTSHYAAVDANFHQDNPGLMLREGSGEFHGRLEVDTTILENGWHRLVLKTNAKHEESGTTNSGIAALLFEVFNDPPCSESCLPAIVGPTVPPEGNPSGGTRNITQLQVNFQPDETPEVVGYLPDNGRTYDQQNEYLYGWSLDITDQTVIHNEQTDSRLNSGIRLADGAVWEISLQNGLYEVEASIGNSLTAAPQSTLFIEDQSIWEQHEMAAGEFEQKSVQINVSDGRLTLHQGNHTDVETYLNYLIIRPIRIIDFKINFQPPESDLLEGYLPDMGALYGQHYGYFYGWNQDISDGTAEYGEQSDRRLDTVAHIPQGGVWEVALEDGLYAVTASIGDPIDGEKAHTLNIEGINFWDHHLLAADQFEEKTLTIAVRDGKLTVDQLGQEDDETHLNYLIIRQIAPAVNINFQLEESDFVSGYMPDVGNVFGERETGLMYGWTADNRAMRIRHRDPNPLLDTLALLKDDYLWEIELPNGTYSVTVGVGDSLHEATYRLNVEGVNYWDGIELMQFDYRQQTQSVAVEDGRLTLDNGSLGDNHTHLNFIEIESAEVDIKINFQKWNTPLVSGYEPDFGKVFAQRENGFVYGWRASNDTMRERQRHTVQLLDTLANMRHNYLWEIALPNGEYEVGVSIGDSVWPETHTINVEGVNYWTRHYLEANAFEFQTQIVTVNDGILAIDQGSLGDNSTHINYVEIFPLNVEELP